MTDLRPSDLVTKAPANTPDWDRCIWGQGWPFDEYGAATRESCPNLADMAVSIGPLESSPARVCGEHFLATAEIMHRAWMRTAALSW